MADPDLKPFNKSVADNYPIAQFIMCGIIACLGLVVLIFMPNYPEAYEPKTEETKQETKQETNQESKRETEEEKAEREQEEKLQNQLDDETGENRFNFNINMND